MDLILLYEEKEFVKAAHILGTPPWKILVNHLLRNSLTAIFVIAIFNCASAVFTEVSLSFLGIGIPPQTPSWGNMLNNAQNDMLIGAWWGGSLSGTNDCSLLVGHQLFGRIIEEEIRDTGGRHLMDNSIRQKVASSWDIKIKTYGLEKVEEAEKKAMPFKQKLLHPHRRIVIEGVKP